MTDSKRRCQAENQSNYRDCQRRARKGFRTCTIHSDQEQMLEDRAARAIGQPRPMPKTCVGCGSTTTEVVLELPLCRQCGKHLARECASELTETFRSLLWAGSERA